jgi:hypothetical protein
MITYLRMTPCTTWKREILSQTVRINSWAEVMDIEDSNDDRKMPAKKQT